MLIYQVFYRLNDGETKVFEATTFEQCLVYLTNETKLATQKIASGLLEGFCVKSTNGDYHIEVKEEIQ